MNKAQTGDLFNDNIKDYQKELEKIRTKEGVCPHCGYCPHCGRSRRWNNPWFPPYTVTWEDNDYSRGGTTHDGTSVDWY